MIKNNHNNNNEEAKDTLELDLDVASGMAKMFLRQPQAREFMNRMGNNPNSLAHIAANTLIKTREALAGEQLDIRDEVWVMGNGVLDELLEDIADTAGIPDDRRGAEMLFQVREKALKILEEYEASSNNPQIQNPNTGALGGAM